MERFSRLSHSIWDCKYDVVWIPKYRRKELYGAKRQIVVNTIKKSARIKGVQIIEGHAMWEFSKFCVTGWVSGSASAPAEVEARSENGPSICHVGGSGFCWSGDPGTIFS